MHSTAELKRQYEQARSKAEAAKTAERDALQRYKSAVNSKAEEEFAARGITPGCKVVGRWNDCGTEKRSEPGIYMGHAMTYEYFGSLPVVRKIKKDGTPHASHEVRAHWKAIWELAE